MYMHTYTQTYIYTYTYVYAYTKKVQVVLSDNLQHNLPIHDDASTQEAQQLKELMGNIKMGVGVHVVKDLHTAEALELEIKRVITLIFTTGMRSSRSGYCVLPPAGARTCEDWTQCACVRRCKEEHTLTEHQSWGHRTIVDLGW